MSVSAELPMREVLVKGLVQLKLPANHSQALRHKKKRVPMSMSARYVGIPNNAILEIVPGEGGAAADATTVNVALAVSADVSSSGSRRRLQHSFAPSTALGDILRHWTSAGDLALAARPTDDPSLTYIRRRVAPDELDATTLRQLGVVDGQIMLRLAFAPRAADSAWSSSGGGAPLSAAPSAAPPPLPPAASVAAIVAAPAAPSASAPPPLQRALALCARLDGR